MSTDLLTAREFRRRILRHIEDQQKADAAISIELRNSIIAISMELLQQVALLLQSYTPDRTPDAAQEALFARIAPSESLVDWLSLCRQDQEQGAQIALLKQNAETAQANYRKTAPLGPATKLIKKKADKTIIGALKVNRDQANARVEQAETARKTSREQMAARAEIIFRSAMRQEALEALRTIPSPVMEPVRRLLHRFEAEVIDLCRHHSETQMRSLDELRGITSALSQLYDHLDIAQTAALPGEKQPS